MGWTYAVLQTTALKSLNETETPIFVLSFVLCFKELPRFKLVLLLYTVSRERPFDFYGVLGGGGVGGGVGVGGRGAG